VRANHDFAHLLLGDLDDTFHHGQGIGIQQVALVGAVQQGDQLLAVFRLAQQHHGEPFNKVGLLLLLSEPSITNFN